MSETKENSGPMAKKMGEEAFFRSYPVYAQCPHCKNSGATQVNQSCSMKALLCAYCCGLCYNIYNILNTKDLWCKDAEHFCASCGKSVGKRIVAFSRVSLGWEN